MERPRHFNPEILRQLPSAVVMVGLHASGKTTFCRSQLGALGFRHISFDDELLRISQDREKMNEALVVSEEEGVINIRGIDAFREAVDTRVFGNTMAQMIRTVTGGRKAVFEGANVNKDTRGVIVKILRKHGVRQIGCVWMNTPLDECLRRLQERSTRHPESRIAEVLEYASAFTPPTIDEGFDMVLEVPFVRHK